MQAYEALYWIQSSFSTTGICQLCGESKDSKAQERESGCSINHVVQGLTNAICCADDVSAE